MSILEIAIIAVIAAAVFFALRRVIKTSKSGGCSCGCAACGKACPHRQEAKNGADKAN